MNTTETVRQTRSDFSLLSAQDLYLFNEGRHYRIYNKLGAHPASAGDESGVAFSVWAPNAQEVSVIGSFNDWSPGTNPLRPRESSGIWEGFVPGATKGSLYKFHIRSHHHGHVAEKADPFGLRHERPPRTASVVWDLEYEWSDREWTPVLLDPEDNYTRSVAALRRYDVLLVNPVRDGLNLVAIMLMAQREAEDTLPRFSQSLLHTARFWRSTPIPRHWQG